MRNGKFSVTLLHLFLFIQSFKASIDLVLTFLPSKKGLKRFTRHWLPVREKRLLVSFPPPRFQNPARARHGFACS